MLGKALRKVRDVAEGGTRDLLARQLNVPVPDHPATLASRQRKAQETANQGDRAAAEAELRDIRTARIPRAGPRPPEHAEHPARDRPG